MKKSLESLSDRELLSYRQELRQESSKYSLQQMTIKTATNSAYGALGSAYFRWFDIRNAEAVTLSGQMIIRLVAEKLNNFLSQEFGQRDYVLGSDTDSVLIAIDPVVSNLSASTDECVNRIDRYCEDVLQPIIDGVFAEIHRKLNTLDSILAMKREAIAEHGVWTAKKRYVLWMHDNEGVRYVPPKLKIVGIEAVRSSTPKYAREVIKRALELFVKNDIEGFHDLIETAETNFDIKPFSEIASPRSINGLDEYPILPDGTFSKKTPFQVKGALVYNRELAKSGLTGKYEKIMNGQKVRFCYVKEQNPFHCNVIAAPGELPVEWKFDRYIDRMTQFDKTVVQPLQNIVQYTGWTVRREATLF